jgi:hypothetical protein
MFLVILKTSILNYYFTRFTLYLCAVLFETVITTSDIATDSTGTVAI